VEEKILQELQEIKKELQDIRSILEQNQIENNSSFSDYLLKCVIHYQAEMSKTNRHPSQNRCDEA